MTSGMVQSTVFFAKKYSPFLLPSLTHSQLHTYINTYQVLACWAAHWVGSGQEVCVRDPYCLLSGPMESMIPAISGRGNEPGPYECVYMYVCVCVCVLHSVLSAILFMRMFVLSIDCGGPDCGRGLCVWSVSLCCLQLRRHRPARHPLLHHRWLQRRWIISSFTHYNSM